MCPAGFMSAAGPLSADSLLEHAQDTGGVTVVVADLPGVEPNLMRQLIDFTTGPPGTLSETKHDAGDHVFLSRYAAASGTFEPVDGTALSVP